VVIAKEGFSSGGAGGALSMRNLRNIKFSLCVDEGSGAVKGWGAPPLGVGGKGPEGGGRGGVAK